jgi:hypothetical protein
MATDTQIANLALLHMNVSNRIANLQAERSIEADAIRTAFDSDRDDVLRDFPWPFATAYATLGLVSADSTRYNNDWFYAYRYPANCLNVRRIVTSAGRQETNPSPFKIGRDDQGKLIFTDQASPVVVEYTHAVTDPQEFDSIFATALGWKLASSCGPALSRVENIERRALGMYSMEISRAQARALNEGQDPPAPEAEWIRGRN